MTVKTVDEKGKERDATVLESWSQSVAAGEGLANNLIRLTGLGLSLLKDKTNPPIDRIRSFDWSEGAKAPEVDRGAVERMGPQAGADRDDVYTAYPRRPATGMTGRSAATGDVAALPAPARALEDHTPKRLAAPPKGLPKPDRGQDR
jgi:hypothetical protein